MAIIKRILPIFLSIVLLISGILPVYAEDEPKESITESNSGFTETRSNAVDNSSESITVDETLDYSEQTDERQTFDGDEKIQETEELPGNSLNNGMDESTDVLESHNTDDEAEEVQAELALEINSKGGLLSTLHSPYAAHMFSISAESQIRQRVKAALDTGDMVVDISDLGLLHPRDGDPKPTDADMLSSVVSEVINSSYQYFYIEGGIYKYNGYSRKIYSLEFRYTDAYLTDGSLDMAKVQSHLAVLENVISEALGCIEPGMSDLEKVLAIHDYLVQICDYDQEKLEDEKLTDADYSTWGVLVDGKAVCQGYAEAFCSLTTKLGINSYFVGSRAMNHAWNLVELDGYWYHVDTTWDDPIFNGSTFYRYKNNDYADEGYVSHTYFLKSDDEFKSLYHYGWSNSLPQAGKSQSFVGYCFDGVNSHMNYYDSYWYYLNPVNRNMLCRAKVDGSEKSNLPLQNTADYVHRLGNELYYSNENGIYLYDITTDKESLYCDTLSLYPEYKVTEFTIKHQKLICVLYDSGTSIFIRENIVPTAAEKYVKLQSITLDYSNLELDEGTKMMLTVSYNPSDTTENRTVLWSSSNPTVAEVSSQGEILALKAGNTIITAKAFNGKTAQCNVKVLYVDPVDAFVMRLYENILERHADEPGMVAWGAVLKSGKEEGAKVAQGFINSKEFQGRSLSDEEYIKIMYRAFLGRGADPSGLKAWLSVLDSGLSRMHVFRGFAESEEFTSLCNSYGIRRGNVILTEARDQNENVTKFVVRCYKLCLSRNADVDGLNGWCQQLLSGANTGKETAYGFVFSEEFLKKNLTDADYVKTFYRLFLNREADPEGLKAWLNVLGAGKSREHVFNGFADSAEFKEICQSYGIQ